MRIRVPKPVSTARPALCYHTIFFFTSWVVYVIDLPDILDRMGIDRDYLTLFILLGPMVLVLSHTAMR